jgi:hypothetical protein
VDSEHLSRLQARLEIMDGILLALERWPDVSDLVSQCEDPSAARHALSAAPFMLSEVQAQHVLDLTLGRRTALGRRRFSEERDLRRLDCIDEYEVTVVAANVRALSFWRRHGCEPVGRVSVVEHFGAARGVRSTPRPTAAI